MQSGCLGVEGSQGQLGTPESRQDIGLKGQGLWRVAEDAGIKGSWGSGLKFGTEGGQGPRGGRV